MLKKKAQNRRLQSCRESYRKPAKYNKATPLVLIIHISNAFVDIAIAER